MSNITYEYGIPVIDISSLSKAKTTADFMTLSEKLIQVYSEVGFAYIVNHGINPNLFENVFEQSRQFHNLPDNEKRSILQNEFYRGYMPFAASTLKVSTLGEAVKPNQSSAFILMHEVDKADSDYIKGINLAGPNQWPCENILPHFKPVLWQYREELSVLAKNMVRLFALGLCENWHAFDKYFYRPTTYLRLQHYPAQPDVIPEHQYGIAPHTDYGFLTLLVQDNVGGLQVQSQHNDWIDVPPLEGGIIVNSGDMLRLISGNSIISTPHRVINTSGKERYSIPFFFEPDMNAVISPLNNQSKKNADFDPEVQINYAEYTMERVNGNYDIGAKS